jgi:Fic family protein
MCYTDKKAQIDNRQAQINAHGELSNELKRKINYKFRLDWNYYSNSIEGNTMTMPETRSVMLGNITIHGKSIKDFLEIKGHDDVISKILEIGKGDVRLSERRIKEIHRGIMHEDNPIEAAKIGVWKTEYNCIYNHKGEKFEFVPPYEVPDRIHKLLDKTNAAIDAIKGNRKNASHPIDIALQFHLEYVLIHPFYDGNGRTARILTNILLIAFGYPPFWVKNAELDLYNQYISEIQGYDAPSDLFMDFVADLILRSQQFTLDAIAGKDIHEPNDFKL